MKKYIYHAYIQFFDTNSGVRITHWDTLVCSEYKKIDSSERYNQLKQRLWEGAGDKVHSIYIRENMALLSLSFLHEVEE